MKKILFITPPFYEYPFLIKRELDKRFDVVDFYISYPTSFVYKIIDFFHFRRIQRYLINHFTEGIINKVDEQYDFVFIIKASVLGRVFLQRLHEKVDARYVQYIWDDLKFDIGAKETFPYFDKILSYNPRDCMAENLVLRTNFCDREKCEKRLKKYDILFVASYKPNRLEFVKKILPQITSNGLSYRIFIKTSILMLLLKPSLWKFRKLMIFKPLSYNEMMANLAEARVMIDVAEKNQDGLTTRPFEALAVNTKIMSTNPYLKDYDFYDDNNVQIVDESHPVFDISWIKDPYNHIPETILNKYTISSFIDDVLF